MTKQQTGLVFVLLAVILLASGCAARGFGQAKVRTRGAIGSPPPRRPPQVVVQVVNNTTNLHLRADAPGIYEGGGSGCIMSPGGTCELEFYPPQGTLQSVTMAVTVRAFQGDNTIGTINRSYWLRGVPWGSGIGGSYSWPQQRVYVLVVDWVRGALTYEHR